MIEILLGKVIVFVLCFSVLNVIREINTFYVCYKRLETYNISNKRMIGLWASISYILTIIFMGI
jgi:hypothetical protein